MMNVPRQILRSTTRLASKLRSSQSDTIHGCCKLYYHTKYVFHIPPPDVFVSKAHKYRGTQNKLFESKQVQEILTRLTGVDLDKVLQKRRQDTLNLPKYSVATEIDMVKEEKIAHTVASKRLKMPPIREVRSPIDIVISEDPYLISFDDDGADYVFTDISTSVDNDTRSINVRENATGVLREADWELRDHINALYWPKKTQRLVEAPPLLQEDNLQFMFTTERHAEVLDLIYVQFELDAPELRQFLHRVYEDLSSRGKFDILASTRFYGGMVFYFVSNERTIELLDYFCVNDRTDAAADVVRLHSLVHTDFKCNKKASNESLINEFKKFYRLSEKAEDSGWS